MYSMLSFLLIILQCSGHWIDPNTPSSVRTKEFGDSYSLVFSDEFNEPGRSFTDGHDARWTAMEKNDYTNNALQYYTAELVTTSNGYLNITTTSQDTTFHIQDKTSPTKRAKMTKHYRSAMIQGWNKFCFTGGVVEIRARLPGKAAVAGLWPAMWLMGNLARATYVSSSDYMWPWSFNTCDRNLQRGQEISACNAVNHFGMPPHVGRGAPEIDILEAMAGSADDKKKNHQASPVTRPYYSASLQVSPGVTSNRPSTGHAPYADSIWYDQEKMIYGDNSSMNIYFYGVLLEHEKQPEKNYQSDAISANRQLSTTHFEDFHTYRLEWQQPNQQGEDGSLSWYLDDELVFHISAEALRLTGASIPSEPMYLLLNTALSSTWGFPDPCPAHCSCDCYDCKKDACSCALPSGFCEMLPAHFLIDYVRVYQKAGQTVGCSTASHPTRRFILAHADRYMSEHDSHPLKAIRKGGGRCSSSKDCGEGRCENGVCACQQGYVGPVCKSPPGFDDIDLDPDGNNDNFFPSPPTPLLVPLSLRVAVAMTTIAAIIVVAYHVIHRRRRRSDGWRQIDDEEADDDDGTAYL